MPNYWVVGASWGGVDHQDQSFIEKGIWMLGCYGHDIRIDDLSGRLRHGFGPYRGL